VAAGGGLFGVDALGLTSSSSHSGVTLRKGGALLGMDDWKEGVNGVYCSGLEAMDSPLDQASAHAGRDGLEGNLGLG